MRNARHRTWKECFFFIVLKHFEGTGKLVRATGAAAFAVYAGEADDDIVLTHPHHKGADSLGIAVASAGVEDIFDDVPVQHDVDLAGAHRPAGLERCPPDRPVPNIGNKCYVKHICKDTEFSVNWQRF